MLSSIIGISILNGLFASPGQDEGGSIITFSGDVYLGLLTKMPNNNGDPYEDGTYFSEPMKSSGSSSSDGSGYFRIRLDTESRINRNAIIGGAETDEPFVNNDGDTVLPAFVTNQELIMFPEANENWDKIVGFGLFRSETGTTPPFLWGSVTSKDGEDGIEVIAGEVPVIRPGDFKVSLA